MSVDRECIGNLYIENQRLLGEYQKLLGLVEQVCSDNVQPAQITVDSAALSWSLSMTDDNASADDNANTAE